MISKTLIKLTVLLISLLNSAAAMASADKYYDYSLYLSKQGKFAESLRYVAYSISQQKRADNLYQKSICLRQLGRNQEAQSILNEVAETFPNSQQANQCQVAAPVKSQTVTTERLIIDTRSLPSLGSLNSPPTGDTIRALQAIDLAGVYRWNPAQVHDHVARAHEQVEHAQSNLSKANAIAKSHLRLVRNYGESELQYHEYLASAQSEIDKVLEPYKSNCREAQSILQSWQALEAELN